MAGAVKVKSIIQDTQGSVQPLYIGGTDPLGTNAALTVTSAGAVQTGGKLLANSLLAEYTVTGSAVTSIDFSGLDINTHKSYRIEVNIVGASSGWVFMYINGDTTNTNYYVEWLSADSSTVQAVRENIPGIAYIDGSGVFAKCISFLSRNYSGYINSQNIGSRQNGSSIRYFNTAMAKVATVTNITQLTITSQGTNSFGVGTTICIYRGDA